MSKIQKIETTHHVYEYELSEDELKLYFEDEDSFWDNFEGNWDGPYMDTNQPPTEYNIINKIRILK
tara:strand:- start:176 stop:373 length:198 start_codon:yes stop_codon:yes gene_type:complete